MQVQTDRRSEVFEKLHEYLKIRVSKNQADLIETFAKRFYSSTSTADLIERPLDDLFGSLVSQWNFIYQRRSDETKVKIFNPALETDGWQSSHTIIQISNDDIPFLVDSTRMEINREDLQVHFIVHIGGLRLKRDGENRIVEILPPGETTPGFSTEAPIFIEVDRIIDEHAMETLRANIEKVLSDVRVAVSDWRAMVHRVEEALQELETDPPPLDVAEIAESKDFLHWVINNNFTFLGSRDYKLIGNENNRALQVVTGTGLGVLRENNQTQISKSYAELPPQARRLALSKDILIIAKTNTRSTVHRDTYTDYIGVKRFNEKGEVIGERRFIGLYTSTAYHSSPQHIPFLRHKVSKVIQDLHYPPDSHNGKEAVHILETLPRDDLLQATHEELLELTIGILHLQERKQVRLFVRKDSYGRYLSCLVYLPRESFTTELGQTMERILIQAFHGVESSFATYFSESILARIHYLIRVNPKVPLEYDVKEIEQKLVLAARSWSDELKTQLILFFGEAQGLKYYAKYCKAFSASYCECYQPHFAVFDIEHIERITGPESLEMRFYYAEDKNGGTLRLKLFHAEHTIALSDVLPTLENMGFRVIGERPHEIIFKDGKTVWVNDFDIVYINNPKIDIHPIRDIFQEAFAKIWFKEAEDDRFNHLIIEAQLNWHETSVLRAYTKYLRQIGFTFSQNYIEQALIHNWDVAKELVHLFCVRFSPEYTEHNRPDSATIVTNIEDKLNKVTSLDEDRILRRLLEVIQATVRTNFFQKTKMGQVKPYLSFKLDPALISEMPLPRPMYEIFVYSPYVEGVHLRGGKVARGGIRWSDRREDFRTEILGLMKAQQVKNSVIVPVGAKGGFFPKLLPEEDRDAIVREGVRCYSTFIRGLLDLTDNNIDGKIIPPENTVRYDEDDTYLVVAADKGTATFSDIANAISKEYNFWLDDAFASGGSAGYDHKKMGITARGAWESLKRHFRELNKNPDRDDFTVIGIGDMSGDVFGNGMLLSKHIKLVGAFNHMHIFLDPNPNPEVSFHERKRLFELPRSSWADYNANLISTGGGVFNRSAKSIPLSPEIQQVLNLHKDHVVPNELIRALLKAPVDLIWNGGIGTYVKSSQETNADVGDRTNDNVRVDGNELTAHMVVEGGNLGFTQLGRIEYSLNDGIINTDFIDNSAGVDCSDHEVNIKILLNQLITDGKMTFVERNILLENMTQEVAELVLRDNYEQTQMLSLEIAVAPQTIDLFRQYMAELEKNGRLNRNLEYLPEEKTMIERKSNNKGLTRPEIAVLFAYCKMYLKQDILTTQLPEDPYFENYLMAAFPETLCKKYLPIMKQHSLRREIIATQVANNMTDHVGVYFADRLQRETGAKIDFIIRAYAVVAHLFGLEALWRQIENLDFQVPAAIQQHMMLKLYTLIRRATRWFLRNRKPDFSVLKSLDDFTQPLAELIRYLPNVLTETDRIVIEKEFQFYVSDKVPEILARSIASCNTLLTSLDIIEGARKASLNVSNVAKIYFELGERLELNWLREQMDSYTIGSQWDELARSSFRDDLDRVQRMLSVAVLTEKYKLPSELDRIDAWLEYHRFALDRWQNILADMKSSDNVGFVTYSVALRELMDFAQTG